LFFFFTPPPPTPIYTLSLHDALPISFVGVSKRFIIFINVVLPQPLGPIITVNWRAGISIVILSRAVASSCYCFVMFLNEIIFIHPFYRLIKLLILLIVC